MAAGSSLLLSSESDPPPGPHICSSADEVGRSVWDCCCCFFFFCCPLRRGGGCGRAIAGGTRISPVLAPTVRVSARVLELECNMCHDFSPAYSRSGISSCVSSLPTVVSHNSALNLLVLLKVETDSMSNVTGTNLEKNGIRSGSSGSQFNCRVDEPAPHINNEPSLSCSLAALHGVGQMNSPGASSKVTSLFVVALPLPSMSIDNLPTRSCGNPRARACTISSVPMLHSRRATSQSRVSAPNGPLPSAALALTFRQLEIQRFEQD